MNATKTIPKRRLPAIHAAGVIVLVALLLFTGCVSRKEPTPSPAPTPVPTAAPPPTTVPATPAPAGPSPTPGPIVTPAPTAGPATPAPAPPPAAVSLGGSYENSTYGFSIRFPSSWTRRETGQRSPAVQVTAPGQSPFVRVSVDFMSAVTTLKEQATSIVDSVKGSVANFAQVGEAELVIAGAPAYFVEFTWTTPAAPSRARIVLVARGAEIYEIDVIGTQVAFERERPAIDAIIASFQLKESQPFGVPRSQALTLADDGPTTLDPALSRETRSHRYVTQVFSGLVSYDKDMNLAPDIAERWEVSPDGRTYTFFLRKNVKFHSGRAVKAADIKYSWERAAQPQTGSQTASTYLGDIIGVKDMLEGKARELSGVKVKDDYTLEVTIDAPRTYFVAKLFYPVAYVVDRDSVQSGGKEWWRKPNGTGPFKMKQWLPDELVILERNTDYYRQPSSLNYIVFRLFAGIPMMMYESGDIDVVEIGGGNIDRAKDESNPLNKELKIVPELSVFYLGFNHGKPPFDDPLVRRAFVQAIDKNKVVGRVLRGNVARADGILPPGMPGYNPNLKPLAFDPAAAKASLAASRYKDASQLPPITITAAGEGGDLSQAIGAVADQWRTNLGVEVSVRLLEPSVFFYSLKKEKNELYDSGWIADYPDPQNFLDVLFHKGNEENTGDYDNPSIDALLDRAAGERDSKLRMTIYNEAEQKLIDDAATIPLWYGQAYYLIKPYVKGYVATPLGIPIFTGVTLLPH
ncbi:MAG: hypothetical protein HY671_01310 [Chloroflexi bacterium]|nr:hypothetical protein [Chloroflexota bacterium]